jgi:SseB protein C-terminal domain/SseB protein N-terminal domain
MTREAPVGFPENEVEAVLLRASRREASGGELTDALAAAELLVPVAGPAPAEDPTRVQLPAVEEQGRRYVPVFTSPSQLRLYGHAGGHLRLRGRELAAMLDPATGLAVNLGGDLGLPLSPEQVRAMTAPAARLPAGQVVRLGEPAEEPTRLLEAIAAGLATSGEVRAAYRALMQSGEAEAPRLVVGLEVDDPEAGRRLLEAVGRAARELGDREVDLLAFGEDGDGSVGSWMQLHTRPFYRRAAR